MSLARAYPPLYDGPERPGSRVPRKFNPMSWLGHSGIAEVFGAFDKEVPSEFWNEDVESAETIAIVSCPCGEEPHVGLFRTEFCPGCDRVFWNLGDKIKVARDPSVTPAEEESSPDGRKLDDGAGASHNS